MLFIAYPVLFALLIAVFVWIAVLQNDPEWVARGGTVLTAISALFLIYEAFFERKNQRRSSADATESTSTQPSASPISRVAQRIETLRKDDQRRRSENRRLQLVVLNSFMIVIGELIQGFGDLGFKLFFGP